MYGYGYGFGPSYLLIIIGLVISLWASWYVNHNFKKYDQFTSHHGISGADAARFILDNAGLQNIQINKVSGNLTDNYNPGNKTLNLSESTYDSTSVAAIGVAAHECGHAIQDQTSYVPMRVRAALVPAVNLGSNASIPLIIVGALLGMNHTLITIGIWLFALVVLFQVVTLPVEFNASGRAIKILSSGEMLDSDEVPMVKKVLFSAALTYVAAAISTALQLLRLIIIFGDNRN
ncbi:MULTISPECIES: zinc metallopeptidase [Companilactobacillus]|jgi:Zn-dependent membrane protease YugP|uniref:Zinc metallopeptidase n=1 Tax=Companilactobacillus pabuli TaxID=2714036 RepID=A0A7L7KYH7_9LACO|nr:MULTISPECIES: zinc metallopeptidase [Companilactobacillus]AKP02651.1 peptidase [Companilactobacillus farciminis]AKS50948.1 peptidase [Companilactobacillus farciminis]MCV3763146.1 zinc metallopeptidase [Companilactobacillus farciminis]MDG5114085.1 zinc metallopeptidase [Companilactobacillus pabuli]QMT84830.1 zinc metallopeptidase [Companilactobacillus pabuli]